MTTSSSLAGFERRMGTLSSELSASIPREIITETAKIYKGVIKSSIDSVTNGGRLRNVGRSGSRVGVRYTLFDGNRAIVQATGPLQIIERDTKAHTIPRTAGTRRLRTAAGRLSRKRESTGSVLSGRKVLVINGTPVMGPVNHPGTRGKHPFERGVAAAESAGFAAASIVFNKRLKTVFP